MPLPILFLSLLLTAGAGEGQLTLDVTESCLDPRLIRLRLEPNDGSSLPSKGLVATVRMEGADTATVMLRRDREIWAQRRMSVPSHDCRGASETIGLLLQAWLAQLAEPGALAKTFSRSSPRQVASAPSTASLSEPSAPSIPGAAEPVSFPNATPAVTAEQPLPRGSDDSTPIHAHVGVLVDGWVPIKSAVARPAFGLGAELRRARLSGGLQLTATLPLSHAESGGRVTVEQQSLFFDVGVSVLARTVWALRARLSLGVVRMRAWSEGFDEGGAVTAWVPALRPGLQGEWRWGWREKGTLGAFLGAELRARPQSFSVSGVGPLVETPLVSLLCGLSLGWELF